MSNTAAGFTPGPDGPTRNQTKQQKRYQKYLTLKKYTILPDGDSRLGSKGLNRPLSVWRSIKGDPRRPSVPLMYHWDTSCLTDLEVDHSPKKPRRDPTAPNQCYIITTDGIVPHATSILKVFGKRGCTRNKHTTHFGGMRHLLKVKPNGHATWEPHISELRDPEIADFVHVFL